MSGAMIHSHDPIVLFLLYVLLMLAPLWMLGC